MLKGFIETKVPPGTPDAVMEQMVMEKKKEMHEKNENLCFSCFNRKSQKLV
jgi:hypothetical protein